MRFAYIDSQGNEVSIPSVDALALRVELGAIGPDTDLYDAQADRWGPAQTHEIFHTLSRDVPGEGGFVAPPPPMAPPPPLPEDLPAVAPPAPLTGSGPASEPEPAEELPSFDFSAPLTLQGEGEAPDVSPAEPEPFTGGGDAFGLDLTLADAPPPKASAAPPAEPALDFSMPPAQKPAPQKPASKPPVEETVSFDFGGGLELAPEPFAAAEVSSSPPPPAMDFSPGSAFGAATGGDQPGSGMGEAPPAWMREQAPAEKPGDGAMDVAKGTAPADEGTPSRRRVVDGEDPGARPQPKNRPSPPRRTRSRSLMPILFGVMGLAVVGGGGYFGWKAFQARSSASASEAETPALPAVIIPTIPAELLPRMRDMGEIALVETLDQLRAMQAEFGIPVEPNPDWLAGVYLANAAQYRDVQVFWEGIEAYVDRVRETDTQVFHDRYVAQLEAAAVASDTAAMLLERADSGFLSTREDRFEAYALMDDLVNAALDLHEFLLLNEANIEYAPAGGGVSRDPVLEAVPATKELGEEMWDRVDRITGALDALGTLDKVTTERLTAVLFDRIRRAGFQ
ncbi:MAG: hypothetical protein Q8N53_17180 [Longimicrobiales bacterium]|nr:hypothetical protein [Longimicrobiales bacterium]